MTRWKLFHLKNEMLVANFLANYFGVFVVIRSVRRKRHDVHGFGKAIERDMGTICPLLD
jgi:hypothetical protein